MNINLAPVDEMQLKQLVKEGYYTSVAEAVRFAVKIMLRESALNTQFYEAVYKGMQSLQAGKGIAHTPELEDEIWQEGLARVSSGQKPSTDVIPQ